jgi:hypothetical protein
MNDKYNIMKTKSENTEKQQVEKSQKPVDEDLGFHLSSSIKIYDPNTEEVLVQMRGDN